jgi:protocatechuate 3,4-dioxygenase beta subunit
VITGKVTDSEGKPLIEERVSLMPADEGDQRRPLYVSGSGMTTDDRGMYRIFGLPAGRYKVSVGDPRFNTGNRRRATVQTFYPDVTDLAKAGVVEIKEGSEANKIDITIGEAPQGYSVTGRVVDGETGTPISNVYIQLTRIEVTQSNSRGFSENIDVQTNAQGQFRLTNVRPGKYDLNMYAPDESNARIDAPVRFDVFDQDVTGLVIKTTTGATVAGTVVFEGAKGNPTPVPAQIWIMIYNRSDANSGVGGSKSTRVRPDGTFVAGGLSAGIANFNIETMNNKGFTLARVERDGVPQPNGIQIQTGEHVSGLRLVMTFSNGSIRGVVRIENGTLPPTARISVQITKAGEQGQFARAVEVDARGHFLVEGLAAGTYELRAAAYSPEMQRQRVRPPMSAKQIVIVNEGAAAEVTLTLDLTPPPIQ